MRSCNSAPQFLFPLVEVECGVWMLLNSSILGHVTISASVLVWLLQKRFYRGRFSRRGSLQSPLLLPFPCELQTWQLLALQPCCMKAKEIHLLEAGRRDRRPWPQSANVYVVLRETYTCIRYKGTLAIFTYQFSLFQIPPTYPLQTSCSLVFFNPLSPVTTGTGTTYKRPEKKTKGLSLL